MEPKTSTDRNTLETTREPLSNHGHYTVTEIKKLDGIEPGFNAYDLIIRGHTAVIVAENEIEEQLETLAVTFNGPVAVKDMGVGLLRASHILIPSQGFKVLEEATKKAYADTQWIENPLNQMTSVLNEKYLPYPTDPNVTVIEPDDDSGIGTWSDDDDHDNDGAIPVPL